MGRPPLFHSRKCRRDARIEFDRLGDLLSTELLAAEAAIGAKRRAHESAAARLRWHRSAYPMLWHSDEERAANGHLFR